MGAWLFQKDQLCNLGLGLWAMLYHDSYLDVKGGKVWRVNTSWRSVVLGLIISMGA